MITWKVEGIWQTEAVDSGGDAWRTAGTQQNNQKGGLSLDPFRWNAPAENVSFFLVKGNAADV